MDESEAMRARGAAPTALRILLVIGFLVAAGATALVVVAEDVRLLRLGAVLALWAALIAAFAVTRSRRDVKTAVLRQSEAQLAYQLELQREVTARQEYESDLAVRMASAQSEQIAELREQLDRLTEVLSSLADGELLVSRLTLSAESARFRSGQLAGSMPVIGPGARALPGTVETGEIYDAPLVDQPIPAPVAAAAAPAPEPTEAVRSVVEPEPEPAAVYGPEPAAVREPVAVPEPELKPEPADVAQSAAEPEPAVGPIAGPVVAPAEPTEAARPVTEPEPEPAAVYGPEPVRESVAIPVTEPEPEPADVAQSAAGPEPVAAPEPEPAPVREPVAVPEPEPEPATPSAAAQAPAAWRRPRHATPGEDDRPDDAMPQRAASVPPAPAVPTEPLPAVSVTPPAVGLDEPAAAPAAEPAAAPTEGDVITGAPQLVTPFRYSATPAPPVSRAVPAAPLEAEPAADQSETVSVDALLAAYGLTGAPRRRRRD